MIVFVFFFVRKSSFKKSADDKYMPNYLACTEFRLYQSPLKVTELFQHDLIFSYLTACYLYQVMMTLHFLNDVAYDAESTQNKNYVIIASLKSVQQWVN